MHEDLNILVVDDEQSILDILRAYIESVTDYHILTAHDGFEALEIIEKEKIDCCFTDISMPHLDGLELTRRIQQYDNSIPVVIMTGHPTFDNAIETIKNGVVDFLTKPVAMDQVLLTLQKVMEERSRFVDNILLKEEVKKGKQLLKINQELKTKIKEVETVNLIFQKLDKATTSKDLLNIMVNLSGKVAPCDEAHFCFIDPELKNHKIINSYFRNEAEIIDNDVRIENNLIQKVTADGLPCLIRGNNGSGGLIAIPLKIKSNIFGVLITIIRNGNKDFSEKDLYFLNFLTEQASFLIENLALYENIHENLFSTLYAFVETIEARDPYTKQHSARVSSYAMLIAETNGCMPREIEALNIAGYLHDIGKIGIPDNILLKPGRLTDDEFEIIKRHPMIGSNIVGHLGMWAGEQGIIRHHHERYDGNGYPQGLQGEEIPLLARIMSVADVYDAITTDRSYRAKMQEEKAIRIMKEGAGTQFDSEIVDVFLNLHKEGKINSESEPVQLRAGERG